MSKTKEAQATRIAELERQLRETQAQLVHVYSLASANLPKFGDCPGSAVVLTLSTLGGRETLGPIAIRDGLSQATIDALLADFVRSYEGAVALKPKGVKA